MVHQFSCSIACGGEGHGNPLQYSCLENPIEEGPGRLQSMGSWRVGHDWAASLSLFIFMHWSRKWQPTPLFLPGKSQGRESLVGCYLWGRTESRRKRLSSSSGSSMACGIFLNQGSNSCLLQWQAGSLPLSHQGSPSMEHFIHYCCDAEYFWKLHSLYCLSWNEGSFVKNSICPGTGQISYLVPLCLPCCWQSLPLDLECVSINLCHSFGPPVSPWLVLAGNLSFLFLLCLL